MLESRSIAFLLLGMVAAAMAGCETPPASIPPGPAALVPPTRVEPAAPARPPVATAPPDAGAGSGVAGGAVAVPPSGPISEPPSSALVRDGGPCERAIQCESGICEGEGCGPDRPGVCMSRYRSCTRDLRTYCGCDGATFQSSGSCPGRRFSARAACP